MRRRCRRRKEIFVSLPCAMTWMSKKALASEQKTDSPSRSKKQFPSRDPASQQVASCPQGLKHTRHCSHVGSCEAPSTLHIDTASNEYEEPVLLDLEGVGWLRMKLIMTYGVNKHRVGSGDHKETHGCEDRYIDTNDGSTRKKTKPPTSSPLLLPPPPPW